MLKVKIVTVLSFATFVAFGFYAVGALRNQSWEYWYVPYNVLLAFIPLLLAMWLVRLLQKQSWRHWLSLVVTALWLLFLPNSFYIITDFVHLPEVQRVDIVQDILMITQFSLVGLLCGFTSLYMLQQAFARHIGKKAVAIAGPIIILLCSFAIYVGRELRWNSWDIIINPIALCADVFRKIAYPFAHPEGFIMTLSFFFFLISLYWFGCVFIARPSRQ